eukprot:TRINITY_DN1884_c0_g4_i2.p2 TRINITY_DN1884_c0_g4~~TRINITY_DN1884_c0_g4_i2.p2  ORF type:complete len:115 (+),score=35.64 TRINITY_DN1884_c0_g4_i2:68-412(+)
MNFNRLWWILAVLLVLCVADAPTPTEEDVKRYREEFQSYDQNKDGLLDAMEIRASAEGINDDEVISFFELVDDNDSGSVSFDEYVNAMVSHKLDESPATDEEGVIRHDEKEEDD